MATDVIDANCGAKTRKGTPCQQRAGHGTQHPGIGRCSKHGGSTPNAEVAGQVFLARREAAVMGIPLNIEPHEAILECIRIAAGEVAYASDRIAELDPDDAAGSVVTTLIRPMKLEKGADADTATVEEITHAAPALHIWIEARHKAMDRLVSYSSAAIKAGIEERRVKLAESQGQLLVQVIRGVLEQLGVLDHPDAGRAVREQLQLASVSQAA